MYRHHTVQVARVQVQYLRQWLDEKAPPAQVAEGDTTTCASGLSALVAEWKSTTGASGMFAPVERRETQQAQSPKVRM